MAVRHRFLLKRAVASLFSFFVVATVVFVMFRLMPGDVADIFIDPTMSPETREAIRRAYGLDRPMHVQYLSFMANLLQGNLGVSFIQHTPVSSILFDKVLNTLSLVLTGVILAYVLGPIIGAYLAWRRGSRLDTVGVGLVLVMYAAPVFWTGMVAIMIFSFQLGWFPSGGMHSPIFIEESLAHRFLSVDFLYHLVMPLTIGTLYWMTAPAFFMRSNMMELLNADFIEMNRAQGLSTFAIIYKHAARNALLPVMHYGALAVGFAFGGSILVEVVFSWPGVGQTMWFAVQQRDFPLAQGSFLVMAAVIITMNFLVDMLSVYIDPRASQDEVVGT